MDFTYTHDAIGRINHVKRGSNVIVDYDYESTYGNLSRLTHGNVILDFDNFDSMGRAQRMTLTVPEALNGPEIDRPIGATALSAINADPNFKWLTLPGANNYQFELNDQGTFRRHQGTGLNVSFASLGFTPALDVPYKWRVRGLKSDGEIGPWSPWVDFEVYGEPTIAFDPSAISTQCSGRQ